MSDLYTYEGVFLRLSRKAAIVEIDEEGYAFSLEYCHFNPDPLDVMEGDALVIECPSWLAARMGLE